MKEVFSAGKKENDVRSTRVVVYELFETCIKIVHFQAHIQQYEEKKKEIDENKTTESSSFVAIFSSALFTVSVI